MPTPVVTPAHVVTPLQPFDLAGPSSANAPPAWRSIVEQTAVDRGLLARCRRFVWTCSPAMLNFLRIVDDGRRKQGRARLGEINRAVNLTIKYVRDSVQHGVGDYWTSAIATFSSGAGDCEDYAIAKYVALLEAGLVEEDLRLVLVRNIRRHEDHVVLAARHEGRWLVLDNLGFALAEDRDLVHYRPIAAFGNDSPDLPVVASTQRLPELAMRSQILDRAAWSSARPSRKALRTAPASPYRYRPTVMNVQVAARH